MPDFKVKIILNSTGVIKAKSLNHEASQAFQTWYIKHEVQMASKSYEVALLIFVPSSCVDEVTNVSHFSCNIWDGFFIIIIITF